VAVTAAKIIEEIKNLPPEQQAERQQDEGAGNDQRVFGVAPMRSEQHHASP